MHLIKLVAFKDIKSISKVSLQKWINGYGNNIVIIGVILMTILSFCS